MRLLNTKYTMIQIRKIKKIRKEQKKWRVNKRRWKNMKCKI